MQEKNTEHTTSQQEANSQRQAGGSKHVSDHLANERTFLAWLRTGLATIAFGFVVARFGILLRELQIKNQSQHQSTISVHYSSEFGVALTILGVVIMIAALLSFLRNRRLIDSETFHPSVGFAITLTILAALIGILLAIYLFLTA